MPTIFIPVIYFLIKNMIYSLYIYIHGMFFFGLLCLYITMCSTPKPMYLFNTVDNMVSNNMYKLMIAAITIQGGYWKMIHYFFFLIENNK